MDVPFLTEHNPERRQRTGEIAQEVCDYLVAASEIEENRRANKFLPQNTEEVQFPEMPDCLIWSDRVNKFGLMVDGALLDQPKWFTMDMEAVEYGKAMFRSRVEKEGEEELYAGQLEALALQAAQNAPSMV